MIQAERRVGRLEVSRLEVDHPMCRLDRIRIRIRIRIRTRTSNQRIEDD